MDGPAGHSPALETPGRNVHARVVTGSAVLAAGAVMLALSDSRTAAVSPLPVTAELPWLLMLTVVLTAAALLVWQHLLDGRLPQAYVDATAGRPWWQLIVAGAGFSLVNAAVEEAIFRGVLQTALESASAPVIAIAVQALAFGLFHVVGIPSGAIGAVMAGSWGVLLGFMRWRTRGLLAPYIAHVAADATIFCLLVL